MIGSHRRKRLYGWRAWGYIVIVLGTVLAGCVAVSIRPSVADGVHPSFYSAAATMVPILLLAHLVRLGRVSQGVARYGRSLGRLGNVEMEIRSLEEGLKSSRLKAVEEGDQAELQQVDELQRRLADVAPFYLDGKSVKIAGTASEALIGNLTATLLVAIAAGVGTLAALATDDSTPLTLSLTAAGLIWLVIDLVILELLSFQNALVMTHDSESPEA